MLTKIKGLHHLTSMAASTQENSDLSRRSAAPRKEDCEFRRPGGLSQSMAPAARLGSTEVDPNKAITGFHRTSLRLKDAGATRELISFMGYQEVDRKGDWSSFAISGGNGADVIALETVPKADLAASALARCITSPSPWTIGRLSSRFARL
ncbi:hypothetical protein GOC45_19945 [Sinorhizobium meliloti]|nr:hypothetical protein [Sinorhizobium meliloti]